MALLDPKGMASTSNQQSGSGRPCATSAYKLVSPLLASKRHPTCPDSRGSAVCTRSGACLSLRLTAPYPTGAGWSVPGQRQPQTASYEGPPARRPARPPVVQILSGIARLTLRTAHPTLWKPRRGNRRAIFLPMHAKRHRLRCSRGPCVICWRRGCRKRRSGPRSDDYEKRGSKYESAERSKSSRFHPRHGVDLLDSHLGGICLARLRLKAGDGKTYFFFLGRGGLVIYLRYR